MRGSFHPDSRESFLPASYLKKADFTLETMLVTFSHEMIESLAEQKELIYSGFTHQTTCFPFPVYRIAGMAHAGLIQTSVGAPACACLMEEAGWVLGVKNFVFFGDCGALVEDGTSGKLLVPDMAYRDEGTSFHYAEASDWIRVKNAEKTKKILQAAGFACETGKTWTTDALYRETQEEAELRRKDGCKVVEMEIAGVQAMCDLRGYELYPFLYTADSLAEGTWRQRALAAAGLDERARFYYAAKALAAGING